jgi:Protein of unknown function (DUF3616)
MESCVSFPGVKTMSHWKLLRAAAAWGVAWCPGLSLSCAADDGVWHIEKTLVSKKGNKSTDISGIACAGDGLPRACMVIDDDMQAAQFVTVREGALKAGDTVQLIDDKFDGDPLELDGEGVAYANGSFYVIGSHGHPRDKHHKLDPAANADEIAARIAASSQIVRVRLKPQLREELGQDDIQDVERSAKLRQIIVAQSDLQPFVDRRLENNGLTIEGVAVLGARLYAGFRGPSLDDGLSQLLSVRLDALFGDAPAEPKLEKLRLGAGRGVRDLSVFAEGLLVLAGPTGDDEGAYTVHWWSPTSGSTQLLADITQAAHASKDSKPEAILPLHKTASGLRVLILSDGEKQGAPRPIVVPAPDTNSR